jgi:hypothetical protein
MKTKKIFLTLAAVTTAIALTFTACKKNTDGPGADLKIASDNAKFQSDVDEAGNLASESFSFTGLSMRVASPPDMADIQSIPSICGASIDTSMLSSQKFITITFDGNTVCNQKIRSGNITAKLITGAKWKDVGAQLLVTFTNYRVENTTTGTEFTYNGAKTYTNLTGGLIRTLNTTPSVSHKVRGNMVVTFDDGTQRTWWIARRNNYDYNGGNTRIIVDGDSTIANKVYTIGGINRLGNDFLLESPASLVLLQGCGWDRPVNGVRIHHYNNRLVTLTFGVDQQGSPAGGSCAYGYKIEWIRLNGQTGTAVIAY